MSLPNLSGTGRLTADVELRYSAKGTAVASLRMAFNSRRRNDDGTYSDGDTFYVRATAFGRIAENAAESFGKGDELVVAGRLKTDEWSDKQDGSKRSAPSLLLDSIGASTSWATVKVHKTERGGSYRDGSSARPTGTDGIQTGGYADPWGSAPPTGAPQPDDAIPF